MIDEQPTLRIIHTACVAVTDYETGKVCFIQRKKSPGVGSWALPGGKFVPGEEEAHDAAIRELKEETGLSVSPTILRPIKPITRDFIDVCLRVHVYTFVCFLDGVIGKAKVMEPEDHSALEWYRLDNLPKNLILGTEEIVFMMRTQAMFGNPCCPPFVNRK